VELGDTSAWTNLRKDPTVAREFAGRVDENQIATCEMVDMELLWSAMSLHDFRGVRAERASFPRCPIDGDVWTRALDVFEQLAEQGPLHHRRVALPDLLVAAAAEVAGVPVCHYDRDFDVIAGFTGQPVRAIAPLGTLA
jgi:predicted nucleic acid-binding protein